MASAGTAPRQHVISPDAAVVGILALLVDARETRVKDDKDAKKSEVLLANAGLSVDDIVAVTDKSVDAVRKTIQRGRKK